MKTTIELTGDVEQDIKRLEQIKAQISKERIEYNKQKPKREADFRTAFFNKLFLVR